MPTREEREYYRAGYQDGLKDAQRDIQLIDFGGPSYADVQKVKKRTTKRKLSAWNKFVKANAKKPRFRLRSGAPNLKKLGVAFRKTPAGRKKRR